MNHHPATMSRSEIATLLAFCAAFDQRTIGEADVLAWAEALSSPWVPNLGLDEAQAAVLEHYRATSARIAPADVLKRVKDTRALAMSRFQPKDEGVPPNDDWRQARAEIEARLAARGDRHSGQKTAQAQVAASRQDRHAELDEPGERVMTRAEAEARIWAITGRAMTGDQVDAILEVAVAYGAGLAKRSGPSCTLTPEGSELYPLISVLARALLGDEAGATVHELRKVS